MTNIPTEFILWLLGILTALLAWIGARVHTKLDALYDTISTKLGEINRTLAAIDKDLREDIASVEQRVSKVETAIRINHPTTHGLEQHDNH